MNVVAVLQALQVGVSVIKMLRAVQIDVVRLVELQEKAEADGRKISDDELMDMAVSAQAAIDRLEE